MLFALSIDFDKIRLLNHKIPYRLTGMSLLFLSLHLPLTYSCYQEAHVKGDVHTNETSIEDDYEDTNNQTTTLIPSNQTSKFLEESRTVDNEENSMEKVDSRSKEDQLKTKVDVFRHRHRQLMELVSPHVAVCLSHQTRIYCC